MRTIAPTEFQPAAPPQPLAADEIHLWFFPQWRGPARHAAESADVRSLLAAYLDGAGEELVFVRDARGKPRLTSHALEFNLSHSGGALLVALARGVALGVDVELPRRARPVLELAQRFFDERETRALAALPAAQQQRAFLRLWACKEAVLKAHGGGIGAGLQYVPFELDDAGDPAGALPFGGELAAPDWQVVRLSVGADADGALAWQGADRHIRAYRANVG